MVRRRKSNLPKWRYEFDCRKCDNIREVHDPRKGRDGDYCIPCIERMDSRRPSPIHADEKERVLRCECFTPIPEDEEEKKCASITKTWAEIEDAVATAFARLAGRFTRRGVSECRKSASIIARST